MQEEAVVAELRRLNAMFALAFAPQLEEAIKSVVRTEKQWLMWSRMDGNATVKEIAGAVAVTPRAVHMLVVELVNKGLVTRNDGQPKRTLDLLVRDLEEATAPAPGTEAAA